MTTAPTGAAPASAYSFPRQDLIVLLLSLAGGSVDAVMILGFNVLTAAQTGNTILLAVSLAQGRFATGFYSAVSVIGYMAGAAVGELVIVRRRDSASWLVAVWLGAWSPSWLPLAGCSYPGAWQDAIRLWERLRAWLLSLLLPWGSKVRLCCDYTSARRPPTSPAH